MLSDELSPFSRAWYEVQTNFSLGGVPRVTQLIEPFIQEVFKSVLCAGAFLYARAVSNKPGGGALIKVIMPNGPKFTVKNINSGVDSHVLEKADWMPSFPNSQLVTLC